ncbi:MAG: hypothetical protein DMF88_06670 [Acidobacteria bacterium]|nr:MAG: hypothetical protein DMF88_06670 [Acidobacteriota bacterium]
MKFTRPVMLAAAITLAYVCPALAHHSFAAAFDASKPVVVTGLVREIRFVNPHSQFVVDVTDASGKTETWKFEASTPSSLIRSGFKPGTVKVGEKVTVKGSHARDMTQNAGVARDITTADGRTFIVGPAGEEGPGAY